MENARELFVKALMEAERLDNAELPGEDEIEWEFSEKFEKSMDKLIRKNNRIRLSTRRTVTKGLLAALIASIVIFAALMSVTASREPIIEFVKKIFPQFNEITLNEASVPPVDTIETEYTLSYLPDSFELDTYQKSDYSVFSVWKNAEGDKILFTQSILDSNYIIDNEHDYQELEINGIKAYWTENEYTCELRWSDGDYCFVIKVPSSIKSDIVTIQQNVSEKV